MCKALYLAFLFSNDPRDVGKSMGGAWTDRRRPRYLAAKSAERQPRVQFIFFISSVDSSRLQLYDTVIEDVLAGGQPGS